MGSDRGDQRRSRRKAADCRKGRHRFGPRPIGGGMTRQTCYVCGRVSIDLTRAEMAAPAPDDEISAT